jgi:hypothetical protein
VLGLADEVSRDMGRVGAVIGQHRNLGGTRLGINPDLALQDALRGGDPDIARARHQVDSLTSTSPGQVHAVGEHGDGLRAPDRIDLVHSEQAACGEDGGVWQTTVVTLSR